MTFIHIFMPMMAHLLDRANHCPPDHQKRVSLGMISITNLALEDSVAIVPQKPPQLICGGCYMPIPSLKQCFYIDALEQHFHPNCFKCIVCQCLFSESVPYIPSGGKAYCHLDFQTIFSVTCAGW